MSIPNREGRMKSNMIRIGAALAAMAVAAPALAQDLTFWSWRHRVPHLTAHTRTPSESC